MSIEKDLMKLKDRIEDARTSRLQAEGKLSAYMEKLQRTWGFKTIDEADEALNKMHEQIEEMEESLEKEIKALEKMYAQ